MLTSHPRSGTTLVEQVLDSHDQLISADEFDVFTAVDPSADRSQVPARDADADGPRQRAAGGPPTARATYWQQTEAIFDEPIGDRMLLDKNPGMMIFMPVVNWAFPEMKMLIALRDPRDVVLSCFMQKVPLHADQLQLAVAGRRGRLLRPRDEDLAQSPRADAQPVARIPLRRRRRRPGGEARRILEFLGLPWDDKVLKFYEHAREKIVRSPTYKDVTQPVYHKSVGRWQHYARHFEPILETLEPFVKEFGYE